jgi:ATP-dependent Clp protease ATP-binding subunit ClpX
MCTLAELRIKTKELIYGQDAVIDELSIVFSKHLIKNYFETYHDFNATVGLLIGETGVGKTFIVKTMCKILGLPLIFINAKSISQEGWSGKSFIQHLTTGAWDNRNHSALQNAVVLIDEFDKLCTPCSSSNSDNYSELLQHSILPYLESYKYYISETQEINTRNFLFLCTGTFKEIYNETSTTIGFNSEVTKEKLRKSLEKYGIIKELLGRISFFITLNPMSENIYRQALDEPKSYFNSWIQILNKCSILNLSVVKKDIVTHSLENNLGMRGLIQECDKEINNILKEHTDTLSLIMDDLTPTLKKEEINYDNSPKHIK